MLFWLSEKEVGGVFKYDKRTDARSHLPSREVGGCNERRFAGRAIVGESKGGL